MEDVWKAQTRNRILTVARTGLLFAFAQLGDPSSESLWKGWGLRSAARSRVQGRLQYQIDGTTSIVSALGFSSVETSDDAFKHFHQKLSSFLSPRKLLPEVPCCFPVLCSLVDNQNDLSAADL